MNNDNHPHNVASIGQIGKDLHQLLGGYGTGGRVTPDGRDPDTGKTVRETLEEIKANIDAFLGGA
jgi:hypothetical protein